MNSWGAFELARRQYEQLQAEREATPRRTEPTWAPGSMEWLAESGTRSSNPLRSSGESVSPVSSVTAGAKAPLFGGAVSLDETRERDVLATSRPALALFSDRH